MALFRDDKQTYKVGLGTVCTGANDEQYLIVKMCENQKRLVLLNLKDYALSHVAVAVDDVRWITRNEFMILIEHLELGNAETAPAYFAFGDL